MIAYKVRVLKGSEQMAEAQVALGVDDEVHAPWMA
jgi:hypothetical protein